jgi:hypothetical protein
MKIDWKRIAQARGLDLPADDIERIVPVLDTLEAAFQPLLAAIPHDLEPAVILSTAAVSAE